MTAALSGLPKGCETGAPKGLFQAPPSLFLTQYRKSLKVENREGSHFLNRKHKKVQREYAISCYL